MGPHTMPGGGGKAMRRRWPIRNHRSAPAISINAAALAVRNFRLRIRPSRTACTASQIAIRGQIADFS